MKQIERKGLTQKQGLMKMTHHTLRRRRLASAVVAVSLVGITNFAHANEQVHQNILLNGKTLAGYMHGKMFGDYGPISAVTGKPIPRFVNGKRVLPEEGWFTSSMRGSTDKLHHREGVQQFTRLTEQNLTLDVPNGEWFQRPLERKRNDCLILYRKDQRIFVSLAANRVGVEAKQTNLSLLAASQQTVKELPNAVLLPEVRELSAPGLAGLTYQSTRTHDDGQELLYSTWLAAKNGYTYDMVVYGEIADQEAIDQTMREFVSRMREKKPNHVAYGTRKPNKWRFW